MKTLALLFVLGMAAQGQTHVPTKALVCTRNVDTGEITPKQCAEPVRHAVADATDGKPPGVQKPMMDVRCMNCAPAEPMDVPAVRHKHKEVVANCYIVSGTIDANTSLAGKPPCTEDVETYTCKDQSRVLLTSEDGKKHCIKFK
jgi:hypothetical protein